MPRVPFDRFGLASTQEAAQCRATLRFPTPARPAIAISTPLPCMAARPRWVAAFALRKSYASRSSSCACCGRSDGHDRPGAKSNSKLTFISVEAGHRHASTSSEPRQISNCDADKIHLRLPINRSRTPHRPARSASANRRRRRRFRSSKNTLGSWFQNMELP
jgi:hypothetical protein